MRTTSSFLLLLLACASSALGQTHQYTETVAGASFVMKAIPGGSYFMGCSEHDEPCADAEWVSKASGVRLRQETVAPFYLAETETTWALYQTCIDAGVCANNKADGGDNGWGRGARPVIEVNWNEVTQVFLPWLSEQTGRGYRLPTEAEWEYAARAGTTTRYPWGEVITCSDARYGFVDGACGQPASTVPVKTYAPNAFGLYDMHGNVWEMVQDCWREDRGTPAPDGDECAESVLRGGSWLNAPANVRSAARFRHERTFRESGDGFRIARDAD